MATRAKRTAISKPKPITTLPDAVRAADLDAIRRLVSEGAPLDPPADGTAFESPLSVAIDVANSSSSDAMVPVVGLLVDLGADVNRAGPPVGSPPLWWAAYTGCDAIARVLVARGAVVTGAPDTERHTIVHNAAAGGLDWLVAKGLEAGVDPDAATSNGHRAMHYAFSSPESPTRDNVALAERLVRAGAALAPNNGGWGTPLHWAASKGGPKSTRWLVERGTPIEVREAGAQGLTPLLCAAGGFWPWAAECVTTLLELGADARAVAGGGLTSLHCAARAGNLDVIEALLSAGADPRAKTSASVNFASTVFKAGTRPADIAKRAKHAAAAARLA